MRAAQFRSRLPLPTEVESTTARWPVRVRFASPGPRQPQTGIPAPDGTDAKRVLTPSSGDWVSVFLAGAPGAGAAARTPEADAPGPEAAAVIDAARRVLLPYWSALS